jgi:hypothetical protein
MQPHGTQPQGMPPQEMQRQQLKLQEMRRQGMPRRRARTRPIQSRHWSQALDPPPVRQVPAARPEDPPRIAQPRELQLRQPAPRSARVYRERARAPGPHAPLHRPGAPRQVRPRRPPFPELPARTPVPGEQPPRSRPASSPRSSGAPVLSPRQGHQHSSASAPPGRPPPAWAVRRVPQPAAPAPGVRVVPVRHRRHASSSPPQ